MSPYGGNVSRSAPDDAGASGQSYGGGAYQTMCVRTCDGYYWPVNAGATRSRMPLEDRICAESCDTEAKLFYLPRGSSDIANMVDLTGRPYSRLPNAFGYRSSLIAGCSCRPMPWSTAEAERHEGYRVAETLGRERRAADEAEAAAVKVAAEAAKAEAAAPPAKSENATASVPPPAAEAALPADPPIALDLPSEMPAGGNRSYRRPAIAAVRDPDQSSKSEMIIASAELTPSEMAEITTPAGSTSAPEAAVPGPAASTTEAKSGPATMDVAQEPAAVTDASREDTAAPATTAPWQPAIAARIQTPDQATAIPPAAAVTPSAMPEPSVSEPDAAPPAMTTPGVLTDTSGAVSRTADPSSTKSLTKMPSVRTTATAKVRAKASKEKTAVASWLGQGGGKYTWPGDAPQRRQR